MKKTIYSIVKRSLDYCTRMTEPSKIDEVKRVVEEINEIIDNPVPSLDLNKSLKTFIKECEHNPLTRIEDGEYAILNGFVDFIKENGVETNKSQPSKLFDSTRKIYPSKLSKIRRLMR